MATSADDFEEWLSSKLKALNTDQDVFGTYIRSILEGDETKDEKLEALEGILVEISVDNTATFGREILDHWNIMTQRQVTDVPLKVDVGAQIASIMEKQAQSVVTERKMTEEERKYKEAILAQYSQISDGDDDVSEADGKEATAAASTATAAAASAAVPANDTNLLLRNTNAEDVFKAEREKRDKAKAEVEKKKAQDKANKEKQKQQHQERKEKEKKRTQKGERRR